MRRYCFFVWVLVFALTFFLTISVVGASFGVSPSSYKVSFEPNLEKDFVFNFIFDDGGEAETYVEGDLAEFVSLSKTIIDGSESVIASLKFPKELPDIEPGEHRIRVGAKQVSGSGGIFGVAGDVGGIIKVSVPYPGKHITADFFVGNANVGENVSIQLKILNDGQEVVEVKPSVEIYDDSVKSGADEKNVVEEIELSTRTLEKQGEVVYDYNLSTEGYSPGNYLAKVFVDYGFDKGVSGEESFRLGGLDVRIVDYTKTVERDKINRFLIDVESLYNGDIENLYADINLVDEDVEFDTPSISLGAWESGTIEGFFDTKGIESWRFKVNVTLHYHNATTSEIVRVKFRGEINPLWYPLGGAVIALVVGWIIFRWRRKKWKKSLLKQKRK